MDRANTEVEQQEFLEATDRPRTDRRRWVVGGLVAVLMATVIGAALWSLDPDGADTSRPPARDHGSTGAADRSAVDGLVAAFVKHDAGGAAPYLAPGTEAPWPEWPVHTMRDAAWGVEYLMEPCAESGRTAFSAVFYCPFAFHLLGSREVGKGPFPDNVLQVSVTDGKVTSAHRSIPYDSNGVGEHLDSVMTWLGENRPKDAAFLTKDEAEVTPAEWPRWTRLWKQYTQEYVTATNQAG